MEKMIENNNQLMIGKDIEVKNSIIDMMTLEGVQKTLNKINAFHAIVKQTLILDVDYGVIPGTTKPMLFKSGAENIMMLFGLSTTMEIVSVVPAQMSRETDFVSYTIKCCLIKNHVLVSEGIGTCNSLEKKYEGQNALHIANTIMKMAGKRALVDAVLHVASLSAVFSQEAEDIADYLAKEAMDNLGVGEASSYKITFGKHKGKTAGEIYKQDYEYVKWFFQNGRDDRLKKAFEVLSEAVKIKAQEQAAKAKKTSEQSSQAQGTPIFEDDNEFADALADGIRSNGDG